MKYLGELISADGIHCGYMHCSAANDQTECKHFDPTETDSLACKWRTGCCCIKEIPKNLEEICKNCGHTRGMHSAGNGPYPKGFCPGPEGRFDWGNAPGTEWFPADEIETTNRM